MIDVESLVTTFLRSVPEVTAYTEDRVYSDLPHVRDYPLVLIQRSGGGYLINRPMWLEEAILTIDVYGNTHKEAESLTSVVLAAMGAQLRGAYPQGCVTAVRGTQIVYNPEPEALDESGHARARFTVSASVLAHPL